MDNIKAPISDNFTQKLDQDNKDLALSEYSPKDAKWDTQRAMVQKMSDFLYAVQRFERWAERMDGCTRTLEFGEAIDLTTGEVNRKLLSAFFCHCRHCQLCDGRKALVRMARFKAELPKIEAEHPKARWILLTLTVPNCPVKELRATLGDMNTAWRRLIKRKAFKPVLGWIRATEVTQDKKRPDFAHPHFHCLLLVPSSWFGNYYVTHAEWLQLWRDCYHDQSITQVDVRAIKGGTMRGAVETLKAFNYSMKVDELISRSPEWILEYMEQVHKLRFLATGGVLKDALKRLEDDPTTEEMLNPDEDTAGEVEEITNSKFFTWRKDEKKYRLKREKYRLKRD